jgi:uncharacterized protein YndB with AHSA1/START domain
MPTTTIPAIEREVEFHASPERVWRAITVDEELSAWFGHRTQLDLRPGGLGWFEWDGHGRFPVRIDVVEPPTRLVWSWGDVGDERLEGPSTEVEWRLEPLPNGGTRLRLRESGFATDGARWANSEGWLSELAELAGFVASEPWQGGIRRTYTFRSPVERVWQAFADPAQLGAWWGDIRGLRLDPGSEGWFDWPSEGRHAVRIEAVEPPRYLAWSWTIERDTILADAQEVLRTEWFLQPAPDGGTVVHLFEWGFIGPENHGQNSLGWDSEVEPVLRRHLGEVD